MGVVGNNQLQDPQATENDGHPARLPERVGVGGDRPRSGQDRSDETVDEDEDTDLLAEDRHDCGSCLSRLYMAIDTALVSPMPAAFRAARSAGGPLRVK